MSCKNIREQVIALAAKNRQPTGELASHLAACAACTAELASFRKTMAMLDEWQSPEPSLYFDQRLRVRLREEAAQPAGWLVWLRRPALAVVATLVLGVGLFLFQGGSDVAPNDRRATVSTQTGSAVADLQALDRNEELYAEFDLLDELPVENEDLEN